MIKCGSCQAQKWCLYEDGQWICKECYLEAGGDMDAWNEMNQEARQRRIEKRTSMLEAEEIPNTKTCKYGCKTLIFWDENIAEKNKYVETETGLPHTFTRCSQKLASLK